MDLVRDWERADRLYSELKRRNQALKEAEPGPEREGLRREVWNLRDELGGLLLALGKEMQAQGIE